MKRHRNLAAALLVLLGLAIPLLLLFGFSIPDWILLVFAEIFIVVLAAFYLQK